MSWSSRDDDDTDASTRKRTTRRRCERVSPRFDFDDDE